MISKKVVLSLMISAVLSADQKPISKAMLEQFDIFGSSIKVNQVDGMMLSINTPVRYRKMLGGSVDTVTFSNEVKNVIERNCLAYGGDVYFDRKDNFGDTVSRHSFNQEIVGPMTPEQRMQYIAIDPNKSDKIDHYVIGWFDLRKKVFTDERLHRSFMFDTDNLRPESLYYDTTCKEPVTNKLIYTAHSKKVGNAYDKEFIEVSFSDALPKDLLKRPATNKIIDDVFAGSILDTKGNKLIVGYVPDKGGLLDDMIGGINEGKVQSYCEGVGGTLIIDGAKYALANRVKYFANSMGCADIEHPFTLTKYAGKYIISKDTIPVLLDGYRATTPSVSPTDVVKEFAKNASKMPLGTTSENNIGNRKLVATVYANNGGSTLVNVQESGNVSGLRNYQVTNGVASDITDSNWTFESISRLPKKMVDAKKALTAQCSAYGASLLSIDNYTASCARQVAASSCLTNMIYTRGNQFAGKESFDCAK